MTVLNSLQQEFLQFLQHQPVEILWFVFLMCCFSIILILLKYFGESGLYLYNSIAIVVANIQVLKAVQVNLFSIPVALGTAVFTSTFLVIDILNEYYSAASAKRAIWLGFAAYALMNVFMIFTMGFKPLTPLQATGEWSWALDIQGHMEALFLPGPNLLIASMLAYLLSRYYDVWIFSKIKTWTNGRFLWLRNNVATLLSSLLDNIIFSLLAWKVLAIKPLPWDTLIFTYILGTYILRVIIAFFGTPFIYIARYFVLR